MDRPGSVLPPLAVSSARWAITSCSTMPTVTMFWALRPRRMAYTFCSADSSMSPAVPVPSCTMAVMLPAADATCRISDLSSTICTYSMTLALVGVTSISCSR